MASNRSNSSKVKSEGNVKNRAISLSFELILQILRKGNYFLVTIQIFLQENARFLHFWLIFDNFGQIQTNNPAISDRAASFSSSVLFAGDGVCGTVIDIFGRAAKPDTRADYRLRHHLYLFYYWLLIHLFHNNYCLR